MSACPSAERSQPSRPTHARASRADNRVPAVLSWNGRMLASCPDLMIDANRGASRGRRPVMALVVVLFVALGSSAAGATTNRQEVTVYSVASGVQFLNNADDLARGAINNPFNPGTNKLKPRDAATGSVLPGDVALFSFNLYANADLKKSAGSASYTCYFNYASHALCMAYYELSDPRGTVVAAGPVNFNAKSFSMVVTGGTEKFFAASGEVTAAPAQKHSQRDEILLLQ